MYKRRFLCFEMESVFFILAIYKNDCLTLTYENPCCWYIKYISFMSVDKSTSIITVILLSWVVNKKIFFCLEVSLFLQRFAVLENKTFFMWLQIAFHGNLIYDCHYQGFIYLIPLDDSSILIVVNCRTNNFSSSSVIWVTNLTWETYSSLIWMHVNTHVKWLCTIIWALKKE